MGCCYGSLPTYDDADDGSNNNNDNKKKTDEKDNGGNSNSTSTNIFRHVRKLREDEWHVQYRDKSFWCIIPISVEVANSLLPPKIKLGKHPFANIPEGMHPLVLEMATIISPRQKSLPCINLPSFCELKVEIPYCVHADYGGPIMCKPFIYVNSPGSAPPTRCSYNLNCIAIDEMEMTENKYIAKLGGKQLVAEFEPVGDFKKLHSGEETNFEKEFQSYIEMNRYPWLSGPGPIVAYHRYFWDEMSLRPSKMHLKIDADFFPKIPSQDISSASFVDVDGGCVNLEVKARTSAAFNPRVKCGYSCQGNLASFCGCCCGCILEAE